MSGEMIDKTMTTLTRILTMYTAQRKKVDFRIFYNYFYCSVDCIKANLFGFMSSKMYENEIMDIRLTNTNCLYSRKYYIRLNSIIHFREYTGLFLLQVYDGPGFRLYSVTLFRKRQGLYQLKVIYVYEMHKTRTLKSNVGSLTDFVNFRQAHPHILVSQGNMKGELYQTYLNLILAL